MISPTAIWDQDFVKIDSSIDECDVVVSAVASVLNDVAFAGEADVT